MKILIQKTLIAILFLGATHAIVAGPTDWAKDLDRWIFGKSVIVNSLQNNVAAKGEIEGGLPFARAIRPTKGRDRAALVVVTGGIISVALYKAYKHFTKPADDTTEDKSKETSI